MTIHYMKEQLYKMGFSETDPCTPCSQNTTGTYLHALWRCSSQSSTFELRSLNNYIILCAAASPQLCIGDLLSIHLQESNASILPIAWTIGKKVIFLNWKWRNCINTVQWKNLLADHISLEKNQPPFIGKPLNLIRSALKNP